MGVNVFRQTGTYRLKETVEAFKADETSVLFGVSSCWEGLDAPGATLETVIIPHSHSLRHIRSQTQEKPC